MRRSLALLLAVLMLCGATITGQTQIQGVFMLGEQAVAGSFVTLAESTLYGTSGTLFNYAARISTPEVLTKPDTSAFANGTDSSYRASSCSSDNTTADALFASAVASGGHRKIYLPDNCQVILRVEPNVGSPNGGTGTNYITRLTGSVDEVDFACHPDATDQCGLTVDLLAYDPGDGGNRRWEWATDTVSSDKGFQWEAVRVGTGTSTTGASCNWTGGYALGSKKIETDCTIRTTGATGTYFGPGDIVKLDATTDSATTGGWDWTSRLTCVDGSETGTSDRIGTDCSELDGDNQVQIRDGLPQSFADGAYYWGANSGHTIVQLERVGSSRGGVGTETTNVAENIWFSNLNLRWNHDELFTSSAHFFKFNNAYDSGVVDSVFHECTGSCIQFGGTGLRASGILIQGNDFLDDVWDNNCFAEVLSIGATNPATVTVYNDQCSFTGDPFVEFSEDVAEPALAGKTFLKTTVDNGGGTATLTITGLDGTSFVTTAGGIAAQQDTYAMALSYCNGNASNIQWINNAMIGTRMGPLQQTGCAGHVMFGNYIRNGPEIHASRGRFSHGNGGAPGGHSEMNDFDLSEVMIASSNPANGEGTNNVWFKNRGRTYGALTWPDGTATGTPQCAFGHIWCRTEFPSQGGASNEDWSYFENTFESFTNVIDDADNAGVSTSNILAPYMLKDLAWRRNRCNGCNLDAAFDSQNPSTDKDTNSGDENDESASVPSAWSSEVGQEPTSIFYDAKPSWWCNEAMTFGQMGAHYDDYGGTFSKLPAQIRYEGGTCTLP